MWFCQNKNKKLRELEFKLEAVDSIVRYIRLRQKLDQTQMLEELHNMTKELDDLQAVAASLKTSVDAAVKLVGDLTAGLGVDPVAVAAVTTELQSTLATLSAAVTPVTPAPVEPTV